jgi:hypothetical protein
MTNKRLRVNLPPSAPSTKRAKNISCPRGTASQPVPVDTQLSLSPSPSPSLSPPPSPRQALIIALQAPNFKATICKSRPKAKIIAPTKGSKQATIVALVVGNIIIDKVNFYFTGNNYKSFN